MDLLEPRKKLITQARQKRAAPPAAHTLLWESLRARRLEGYKFRQQHPLRKDAALEFYCPQCRLAIRIGTGEAAEVTPADAALMEILRQEDICLLQITEADIRQDLPAVLEKIALECKKSAPQGAERGMWQGKLYENERSKEYPYTLADEIRQYAQVAIILPARRRAEKVVSFTAQQIHSGMGLSQRFPAVCAAIDAEKFQTHFGVLLIDREGPPESTTVKWTFEVEQT